MKTLIAASIILASGITQAQSFDYEKAVGSSELYSTLWSSCDELRGGMDASQYKDYVLVLQAIAGHDASVFDRYPAKGTPLHIDARGRPFSAVVSPTPFYTQGSIRR